MSCWRSLCAQVELLSLPWNTTVDTTGYSCLESKAFHCDAGAGAAACRHRTTSTRLDAFAVLRFNSSKCAISLMSPAVPLVLAAAACPVEQRFIMGRHRVRL